MKTLEGLPSVSLVSTSSKTPQPLPVLFKASLSLSPRCQPLLWSLTPAGKDVLGPGKLPQPHQVPPLRVQPLLFRPRQPGFLLWYLDPCGQDQLRVICGLVLHAPADLVQGPGHLRNSHHGPRPSGLFGGPEGAPLPPGPVFRDTAAPVRHADHPGDPHLHTADPAGAEGEGHHTGDHPKLLCQPGEHRGGGELGLRAVSAALLRLELSSGLVPRPQPEQQRVGVPSALLLPELVGDQRLLGLEYDLPRPVQPSRTTGWAPTQHRALRGPCKQLYLSRGLLAEPAKVVAQQPHLHRGHLSGRRSTRAQLHVALHIPVQKPGPTLRQARPVPLGPALPKTHPDPFPDPCKYLFNPQFSPATEP